MTLYVYDAGLHCCLRFGYMQILPDSKILYVPSTMYMYLLVELLSLDIIHEKSKCFTPRVVDM